MVNPINWYERRQKPKENDIKALETHQLIADLLCQSGSNSTLQRKLPTIRQMLDRCDLQHINDIVYRGLSIAYHCKNPTQLLDAVVKLNQQGYFECTELMLKMLVEVFYIARYKGPMYTDKDFYPKFAFFLARLQHTGHFRYVSRRLNEEISDIINKLPRNLNYLLFRSHFCLLNEYHKEYMYLSVYGDSVSYHIWTWFNKWFIDDSGYFRGELDRDHKTSAFVVRLWDAKYKDPVYMKPNSKNVNAWNLYCEPPNVVWHIEFVDHDRVALSQGDYILCATENKFDNLNRWVRGYPKSTYTAKNKECQWLLGACNQYRTRK
ncbi:uncharacterized protein LOC131994695 [Stomoxys calcitrans]|uniref:uncharacterized protein LOC131994695 n=1 Tax=Stomoxys calcitrans TaxID=35570 RepID=UPI0027E255BA|nr:uncharacterized protein LOC131994695 [Stomoxys calcitrans]